MRYDKLASNDLAFIQLAPIELCFALMSPRSVVFIWTIWMQRPRDRDGAEPL